MLANWLLHGRPATIKLQGQLDFELLGQLTTGIIEGTNPLSPGYWGDINDFDQRSVEAADIALTVWLLFKYKHNWCTGNQLKQVLS